MGNIEGSSADQLRIAQLTARVDQLTAQLQAVEKQVEELKEMIYGKAQDQSTGSRRTS